MRLCVLKLSILVIESLNPYQNLVFEHFLYEQLQPNQAYILLWRNSDSIIIGRAQNPWLETNINYAKTYNIPIIRRNSGGGTVFHDLGNINFSFLAYKPFYNKNTITLIVNDFLVSLKLDSVVNERNDILLNSKGKLCKISGSAYRESVNKGLHHGTLLVNVNLTKLREALKPHNDKLETKAIKSLRSSVANLIEINAQLSVDSMIDKLTLYFQNFFSLSTQTTVKKITAFPQSQLMEDELKKLGSWQWNFGRTPQFKQNLMGKINKSPISGYLETNQGLITYIELNGISTEWLSAIQHGLEGCTYQSEAIKKALSHLNYSNNIFDNIALIRWLTQQVG